MDQEVLSLSKTILKAKPKFSERHSNIMPAPTLNLLAFGRPWEAKREVSILIIVIAV